VARSLDDLVAIAEADVRAEGAMLVPESRDLRLELLELGGQSFVSALGQVMPELGAPFRGALDLEPDFRESSHASENDLRPPPIPGFRQYFGWSGRRLAKR
jgi:hypothetical protein